MAERRLIPSAVTEAEELAITAAGCGRRIAGVETAFDRIEKKGVKLRAHDRDGLPPDSRYTTARKNHNGNQNHFQGIQRVGRHIFISGGDWKSPSSHVFVFDMGSRRDGDRWSSNAEGGEVPPEDGLVGTIEVDAEMWHAGGMDSCGHLLAVPIECHATEGPDPVTGVELPPCSETERSRIVFYYVADPESPKDLGCAIDRSDRKATAVALTRLLNDRYLAAVLSAKNSRQQRVDFYLSRSTAIWDGWQDPVELVFAEDAIPSYQAINFLHQDDPERSLYMIGFHNTSDMAPADRRGRDEARLFKVELSVGGDPLGILSSPGVTPAGDPRRFAWGGRSYNMDSGAGCFCTDKELLIYACHHYRYDGLISFAQFAGPATV